MAKVVAKLDELPREQPPTELDFTRPRAEPAETTAPGA
jgi:hypothetical protein